MYNVKELVASARMVVGKFFILLLVTTSVAKADIFNPSFNTYSSGSVMSEFLNVSFGWFKKLDDEQTDKYHSSIVHSLEYADLGNEVHWYSKDASGYSVPVAEWPKGSGYCRRLHIQTIAFNQQKTMSVTACYNSMTELWTWYKGK